LVAGGVRGGHTTRVEKYRMQVHCQVRNKLILRKGWLLTNGGLSRGGVIYLMVGMSVMCTLCCVIVDRSIMWAVLPNHR